MVDLKSTRERAKSELMEVVRFKPSPPSLSNPKCNHIWLIYNLHQSRNLVSLQDQVYIYVDYILKI